MVATSNPVRRLAHEMLLEWSSALAAHLSCDEAVFLALPRAQMRFVDQVVRLEFPDGSLVQFAYAFYLVNADKRALAVFTEHCDYHVFPLGGVRVFENGVPMALPH